LGTAVFGPKDKIRIRSVEKSVIEIYSSIEARILERNVEIPFRFQLVNKQVDLLGDGILGRDFLE
jgi:glycine cleavage system H lipoate-binding protein